MKRSIASMIFMLSGCTDPGAPDQMGETGDASSSSSSSESESETSSASESSTGGEPVACPAPTAGPTHHSEVTGNEVWTADASPHIVDTTIALTNGAALEIEPCAVVQLAAGTSITVAYPSTPTTGTLLAEGTQEQPIRFEGLDGARWGHVLVRAPGEARLRHVTLEGGGGVDSSGATLLATGDNTLPTQRGLFVENVEVLGSAGVGVSVRNMAGFAEGSTGLVVSDAGGYPLDIDEHAIGTLPDGSYVGNARDEIFVDPLNRLQESATMRNLGVPYTIGNAAPDRFVVGGGDRDAPHVTLTIEPGVTLRFHEGTALEIEHFTGDFPASGALVAVGTEAEPIVFTSAAETPRPGDWTGLWFGGVVQEETRIDHARIEYTGADCGCVLLTCSAIEEHEGAVILTMPPPSMFVTNTVIAHGASHGFVLGFDGSPLDFAGPNAFEELAGCEMTLPRQPMCPDPRPECT